MPEVVEHMTLIIFFQCYFFQGKKLIHEIQEHINVSLDFFFICKVIVRLDCATLPRYSVTD